MGELSLPPSFFSNSLGMEDRCSKPRTEGKAMTTDDGVRCSNCGAIYPSGAAHHCSPANELAYEAAAAWKQRALTAESELAALRLRAETAEADVTRQMEIANEAVNARVAAEARLGEIENG